MRTLLLYGLLVLSFMGVITAQWYDRTQLQAEIERLNIPAPAPETIIEERIIERIEYVKVPPDKIETILTHEVTHEVTRDLTGWETLAQLTEWLAADDTDQQRFFTPSNLLGTCALYSGRLRLNAERSGRYISWQLISDGDYEKLLRGENLNYTHLMNLVEIDGRYFLIEPQNDAVYDVRSKWREPLWTK